MKPIYLTTALGLAVLLAACGAKSPTKAATNVADTPQMSGNMADMGNMAMPANSGMTMAKATGKVTAVDTAAGTITIDHSAIPAVNWPAMTMTFKADPKLLAGVAVGDKVAFDLALKGSAGEVLAIKKQ